MNNEISNGGWVCNNMFVCCGGHEQPSVILHESEHINLRKSSYFFSPLTQLAICNYVTKLLQLSGNKEYQQFKCKPQCSTDKCIHRN